MGLAGAMARKLFHRFRAYRDFPLVGASGGQQGDTACC